MGASDRGGVVDLNAKIPGGVSRTSRYASVLQSAIGAAANGLGETLETATEGAASQGGRCLDWWARSGAEEEVMMKESALGRSGGKRLEAAADEMGPQSSPHPGVDGWVSLGAARYVFSSQVHGSPACAGAILASAH